MPNVKIKNNAWGTLAANITDAETEITLVDASRFPAIVVENDEYFFGTLINSLNDLEIVKVTEITGNILTVVRGQEGTVARPYSQSDKFEQRITAQTIEDLYTQNSQDAQDAQDGAEAARDEVLNLVPAPELGDVGKILQVNSAEDAYELIVNTGGGGGGGTAAPAEWLDGFEWGLPYSIGPGFYGHTAIAALRDFNRSYFDHFRVAHIDRLGGDLRCLEFTYTGGLSASEGFWTELSNDSLSISGFPALASIDNETIALVDSVNEELKAYRFDDDGGGPSAGFTQIGTPLPVTMDSLAQPSICGLTGTFDPFPSVGPATSADVAYYDTDNQELRLYRWDNNTETWSLIGSGLPIPITGGEQANICRLTDNSIVMVRPDTAVLQVYEFDGSIWTKTGNDGSVVAGTPAVAAVAPMNETDFLLFYNYPISDLIRMVVVRFDGTDFAYVGRLEMDEGTQGYMAPNANLTSFFGGRYFAYTAENGELRMVRWNIGNAQVAPGSGSGGGSVLETQEEGVTVDAETSRINFVGTGVTASKEISDGAGEVTVSIPGGGGGGGDITTEKMKFFASSNFAFAGSAGPDSMLYAFPGIETFDPTDSSNNAMYMAVGFNGRVVIGRVNSFVTSTTTSNAQTLLGGCYAEDQDLFVVCGVPFGGDAELYTSANHGVNWTQRANPKATNLVAVAYSSNNGTPRFVAVGNADGADAYIVRSSDGITWNEQSNPQNLSLGSIAYSPSLDLFAAGGGDFFTGVGYLVTAPGAGATWTQRNTTTDVYIEHIVWSEALSLFIGTRNDSLISSPDSIIFTSPDGVTWTDVKTFTNVRIRYLAFNEKDQMLVAMDDFGQIYLSVNATDWTPAVGRVSPEFDRLSVNKYRGTFISAGAFGGVQESLQLTLGV
jgi:hypothetical protein